MTLLHQYSSYQFPNYRGSIYHINIVSVCGAYITTLPLQRDAHCHHAVHDGAPHLPLHPGGGERHALRHDGQGRRDGAAQGGTGGIDIQIRHASTTDIKTIDGSR